MKRAELDALLGPVRAAAREASELVRRAYRKHVVVEHKGAVDLVTAYDRESETLLREEVTPEDIAKVVSTWTGIPVARMLQTERQKLLDMEDRIHTRMINQEDAVSAVANAVRRSRSGQMPAPLCHCWGVDWA